MFQKSFATMSAVLLLLGVGCPSSVPEYGTVPVSGEWSFAMTGSSSNLTCPVGAGGFGSAGSVDLSVSESGSTAVMFIDGQTLVFYEQTGSGLVYQTNTRHFPVGEGGSGTVYFEFVANTQDAIVGTLYWDNQTDCTGAYPFTMELLTPELPGDTSSTPFSLEEGSWDFDLDDAADDCGGVIAGFAGLPDEIDLDYNVNLDTGELDPGDVTLSPTGVVLERVGGSNLYSQAGGPVDLGTPVDAAGDLLLDFDESFTGSMEVSAGGDGTASGTLYYSSGSCTGSATISMTQ